MSEEEKEKIYFAVMKKNEDITEEDVNVIKDFTTKYIYNLRKKNKGEKINEEQYLSLEKMKNYICSRNEDKNTANAITELFVQIFCKVLDRAFKKDSTKRRIRKIDNHRKEYKPNGYMTIAFIVILTVLLGFVLGTILWNIK